MTDMLRRSLGPTIEITVEFEDGLPAIRTDGSQLELAVLNVASNARAMRCRKGAASKLPSGGKM